MFVNIYIIYSGWAFSSFWARHVPLMSTVIKSGRYWKGSPFVEGLPSAYRRWKGGRRRRPRDRRGAPVELAIMSIHPKPINPIRRCFSSQPGTHARALMTHDTRWLPAPAPPPWYDAPPWTNRFYLNAIYIIIWPMVPARYLTSYKWDHLSQTTRTHPDKRGIDENIFPSCIWAS